MSTTTLFWTKYSILCRTVLPHCCVSRTASLAASLTVQVGLKLAPDGGGMVGELILPAEDGEEEEEGGDGNVRLTGKTPELASVGMLRLGRDVEVLLFLDKQPFQKDRLHIWVAAEEESATGDIFTATKCVPLRVARSSPIVHTEREGEGVPTEPARGCLSCGAQGSRRV